MNLFVHKTILILAVGFLSICQAADIKPYMEAESLPNAVNFLPPPPDTPSAQFAYDVAQYAWGKAMRADSARAAVAIAQGASDIDTMAKMFSDAFGMELSAQKTPAIINLLRRGVTTFRRGARIPKAHYMRIRPFVRYGEPTLIPEYEAKLAKEGSFPSGHTIRAWGMGLLLAEVNPGAQDALMKYAYEWGESRVIAGYHWQSDVDASKLIASAVFATLHTNEEFMADMRKARAEFKKLSSTKSKKAAPSKQ